MATREETLRRIRESIDFPATARELMQRLQIPRDERLAFRRHLKGLAATGELVLTRGHRYSVPGTMNLVVGRVRTSAGGFGFVVPEGPEEDGSGDVYIPAAGLGDAMHGDRVVARIDRVPRGLRPEGRILKVLSRAHAIVVGRYHEETPGHAMVTPFDDRLLTEVHISRGEEGEAREGDMVTVELTRWPTPARGPAGRVAEVLGRIDEPGVDTRIIIRKYGLADARGAAAVDEARKLTGGHAQPSQLDARPADTAGRTDFRAETIVTIDGEHARDFDDAVSVARLPNGHYRLGVHIADVSHYVREGSALDEEAFERGTSVYFPERALHMFPEALATGLCSLNPGTDRLVVSCLMEIDGRGRVVRHEYHDGVIRTRARMTYTEVNRILTESDGEARERHAALVPMLELMAELHGILSERRRALGSIDFDLEEPEIVLDDEGMVESIVASERNIAHRIIEEFMLLANETVATSLQTSGGPGLYRIHEAPDPVKVERFEQFVTGLGCSLAAPPDGARPSHFQALLRRVHGLPEERPVALQMLRTMQKARYAPANLGHFGLAFPSYTHFTSPIRRYPDLVVHRLLRRARAAQQESRTAWEETLPDIARHVSEAERRAEDAERELIQWKKVRFMADKIGDEFHGFVTGVAPFGLFVELVEHFVEGLVHVASMADDYYRFDEASHTLRGETTRRTYRLGDKVHVQVVCVDMWKRSIDLGLVDILDSLRRDERNRGARRSRGTAARAGRARGPARTRRGRAGGGRR